MTTPKVIGKHGGPNNKFIIWRSHKRRSQPRTQRIFSRGSACRGSTLPLTPSSAQRQRLRSRLQDPERPGRSSDLRQPIQQASGRTLHDATSPRQQPAILTSATTASTSERSSSRANPSEPDRCHHDGGTPRSTDIDTDLATDLSSNANGPACPFHTANSTCDLPSTPGTGATTKTKVLARRDPGHKAHAVLFPASCRRD